MLLVFVLPNVNMVVDLQSCAVHIRAGLERDCVLHVGEVNLHVGDNLALNDSDVGALHCHDLSGAVRKEEISARFVTRPTGAVSAK